MECTLLCPVANPRLFTLVMIHIHWSRDTVGPLSMMAPVVKLALRRGRGPKATQMSVCNRIYPPHQGWIPQNGKPESPFPGVGCATRHPPTSPCRRRARRHRQPLVPRCSTRSSTRRSRSSRSSRTRCRHPHSRRPARHEHSRARHASRKCPGCRKSSRRRRSKSTRRRPCAEICPEPLRAFRWQ